MVAHATLDQLESRRLLSATALVHHGLLTVRGTPTGANTINIAFSSDQNAVNVSIHSVDARGKATNFSHAFTGVHSVAILGGAQPDTINVGQNGPAFNLPTYVNGGSGNDVITTGAENDIINGGAGGDTINAGNGNNIVRGQGGYDAITTGSGNDSINAGPGNDTVYSGAGNDVLVGSSGNDYLDAGDGNDSVYAGSGDDSLLGDAGNDLLWGAGGHDYINGGDGNDTLGGVAEANTLLGGAGQDTFIVASLLKNPNNDYSSETDTLTIFNRHTKISQTPPKF